MAFPRLRPIGSLKFEYERDGRVHDNRDNFIAAVVDHALRAKQKDTVEAEQLAFEILREQIDASRIHKSRWNLADDDQLRHLVQRKIQSTLKNRAWLSGGRGKRSPLPNVDPDRWWRKNEDGSITMPPNHLPLDWAEEILATTLDEFFTSIPLFNSPGATKLTGRDMAAIHSAMGPEAGGPAPRLLLAASAGLGKTHATLQRLATHFSKAREIDGDDYPRMNVVYACPTVELARQNAEMYRSMGGHCTVSLGRDYNLDKDPENTPCRLASVVRAIQRAGISGSIQTTLCRAVDADTGFVTYCDHFHDCAYQQQFNPNADVHFVAHSHLLHVMSEANYGRIELLVIDESFLGQMVTRKRLIAPHALVHDKYGMMIVESMQNGINPWHAFREAGITAKALRERAQTLDARSKKDQPAVYPNMSAKTALKAFDPEKGWRADPLVTVLRRIADEYEVGREGDEPIRCLAYNPEHPVTDKTGVPVTAPMIYLQYRSTFKVLRKDMPVLVLDASAHTTTLVELHIPGIEFRRIEVERRASVIQATGFTGSMSKMKGEDERYREEATAVAERFACSYGRVLIGTTKGAIAAGLKAPDNGASAHYGGVRGLNKFEGFDAVVIAGRQQMRIYDLENTARALLYDDPRPLNLTGAFHMRPSGYYLACSVEAWELYRRARAAGKNDAKPPERQGVNVACHADPFIEALRFQTTEAEIQQMIDRPRFARRPVERGDGLIVLLTEIPIDGVEVDLLVPYAELVGRPRPGQRLRQAFDQLGVLPPADVLITSTPGLWPSVKAIEYEMHAVGDVAAHLGAQRWKYRVPGRRGQPSTLYARGRNAAVQYLASHVPGGELVTPYPER